MDFLVDGLALIAASASISSGKMVDKAVGLKLNENAIEALAFKMKHVLPKFDKEAFDQIAAEFLYSRNKTKKKFLSSLLEFCHVDRNGSQ